MISIKKARIVLYYPSSHITVIQSHKVKYYIILFYHTLFLIVAYSHIDSLKFLVTPQMI